MSDKILEMLQDLITLGNQPSVVKEAIVSHLSQYFDNHEKLIEYATSSEILSTFEFVVRYHYDEVFLNGLKEVLACYREAYSTNSVETLNIILSTHKEFSQKENLMWTVKQNAPNGQISDFYDSVITYMKHIGDNLEIGTKHIVYEICVLLKLIDGKTYDYEKIQKYDFGVAISNVLDKIQFTNLLKTNPLSLKLSDWRNIAYHHSYEIEGDKVICGYGKNNVKFELTLDELKSYVHQVVRTSNVFNIARCIFVFDNLDSISLLKQPTLQPIEFRKPMLINQFRISLMSQGFNLLQFQEEDDSVTVVVNDLMNDGALDPKDQQQREIHSSQFLYNVWCISSKEILSVIYLTKNGEKKLKSTIAGDVCRTITNDISYLAHHVQFEDLKDE
ncbi:hypothetical protein [Paenibacillus sp. MMS20-IR301]|uniref:hypothetical protein n=1 Tax=Paenibacillus sp. MMS20-IR301 TaxID=2895946 RepID=UPI0028EB43EA|nr:hypothetical protein [Paenibacillus sp. MMS20-IR301]WNS41576.1 hypothetical protein LOS79_21445 [Paenibacillus sp. MMS20-IR301]